MNTKNMKQQLATIKAQRTVKGKPVADEAESSWLDATAHVIGAVPSGTIGFFDSIGTSFKYHEAVRKGQL